MERALIVGSEKVARVLDRLLVPRYYEQSVSLALGAKARRALSSHEWDLVVINAPLADDQAEGLARDAVQEYGVTTILFSSAVPEGYEDGVITLVKPIEPALLEHTLAVVGAMQKQLAALREENRRARTLLEEARLIGRAKCVLVASTQMTETEAHRFIEKRAMDTRLPKREVAKDILQAYKA
ncbi:MAG: ANTAR domain-containing protein [Coriobacteriales bacterium]|nr:ANTAR domain-containing protein [Coriobacteriales bacterium]